MSGALVSLASAGSAVTQKTTTDATGRFHFGAVPAGRFKVSVIADGMTTGALAGELSAGQNFAAPPIRLDLESVDAAVQVVASREELAEAEVKTEEHQRIAGLMPNFFVTYDWHAAPLLPKQKLELAWKNTIDPVNFVISGAVAGVSQARDQDSGYGYGATGYGKRLGAATGDLLVGTYMGAAVFPILFHQDPRYFYKGTGTIWSRALYAMSTAVICRGDNGRWQFNYSGVLGDLAAGAVSNLYYPAANRDGARLTFENGLLDIAYEGLGGLVQEFVFRHLTPHAPVYGATSKQTATQHPQRATDPAGGGS